MGNTGRTLKIRRLKDEYDLSALDADILRLYDGEGKSLRQLADYLNVRITAEYLDREPFSPRSVYTTLRDRTGEVAEREKTDLRRRLRMHDVDLDELEDDWVSHMSVRSYLRRELGIDTDRAANDVDPSVTLDRLRGLIDREENIVEQTLERTRGLDVDSWEVHTDVLLVDSRTGESVRAEEYLADLEAEDE
ncbi:MAG: rod-determining factor RdfA [Halanaeroarchaeum sp.]